MININKWETPATSLIGKSHGKAAIIADVYKNGSYLCYGLRGAQFYSVHSPIEIATLKIDGKTWMVDDPPHWWAMQEHAKAFHGKVCVIGLGLGLIVHTLHDNPSVDEIVVLERDADVISLVAPTLPEGKATVIQGDYEIFNLPEADGCLFDLFVGDANELLGHAVSVYMELRESYENVRIHGFNNHYLEEVFQAVKGASHEQKKTNSE